VVPFAPRVMCAGQDNWSRDVGTAIDIHFHIVPRAFLDAMRRGDLRPVVEVETLVDRDVLIFHAPPGIAIEPNASVRPSQYDERRLLEALDTRRLDAATVSPPPELFLYWAPPDLGLRIARTMNDAMAQLATIHPNRFLPLCTLPMQDPDGAVRELHRAVTDLGLRGVALCTHVAGIDLDDPRFAPVFAAAEYLGVPVFLHPQNAGDTSRIKSYYLWNVIGFPMETTIAATRLVVSGLFERHPALNIVLAHGGGYLPYQLGRLDHAYNVRQASFGGLAKPPSAYLSNIYCDSLTHDRQALRFLLDRLGSDHVVLGSDHPFAMECTMPVEAVEALALTPTQHRAVLGGTLRRLLRL
jgi:aminocarboxymuconate-semialdehyde decarboxylase